MFKIGEFSRLARVPVKTLHFYDEIGLFVPQQVDPFTSYRYYTFAQLPRLNRILALRGLGFTLEQIRDLLDEPLTPNEVQGMLRLRRAQLQQEANAALERLAQVEIRLRQITQEKQEMSNVDVLIKAVESVTIVGAREVVTDPANMRERCIALNDACVRLIKAHSLQTDWRSFALYHDNQNGIDVEMAYQVTPPTRDIPANGAIVHALPGAQVAYAVYQGSYDDFGTVGWLHNAVREWITANGYVVSGACREYYLQPPRGDSDTNGVMEIQYPVVKR
jgi:DNA-binding transcriptional MerR regulator